ncbi:MAG: hypothetical protein ACRDNZ_22140 [Streptosporangiaceae bacterium]
MTDDLAADAGQAGRFADLVHEMAGIPGVTPPAGGRGFGRSALRFRSKIFAMLAGGRLVLKLPEERVSALVAAGEGVPFDAGKGKPMREWLSLEPGTGLDWLELAREALESAGGPPGP